MHIGMVCPYSFDVPGGVQSHVLQLAEVMRGRGHEVSVLAPFSPHVELPDYVVSGGKAVPIPYNGSVARLRFGPATHRKVKRWISEGQFDVLHLHEPNAPSLSMLALMIAEGPIVATFHTSTTKSLTLSVFQGILRPWHEKSKLSAGRLHGPQIDCLDHPDNASLCPAGGRAVLVGRGRGISRAKAGLNGGDE